MKGCKNASSCTPARLRSPIGVCEKRVRAAPFFQTTNLATSAAAAAAAAALRRNGRDFFFFFQIINKSCKDGD